MTIEQIFFTSQIAAAIGVIESLIFVGTADDPHVGNVGRPDHTLTVSHHTPLRWCVGLMDYGDVVAL
jgi:hypothetical protein